MSPMRPSRISPPSGYSKTQFIVEKAFALTSTIKESSALQQHLAKQEPTTKGGTIVTEPLSPESKSSSRCLRDVIPNAASTKLPTVSVYTKSNNSSSSSSSFGVLPAGSPSKNESPITSSSSNSRSGRNRNATTQSSADALSEKSLSAWEIREKLKSEREQNAVQPRIRRRGLSNTDKQGDILDINMMSMSMTHLGGLSTSPLHHKVTRTSSRLGQKRGQRLSTGLSAAAGPPPPQPPQQQTSTYPTKSKTEEGIATTLPTYKKRAEASAGVNKHPRRKIKSSPSQLTSQDQVPSSLSRVSHHHHQGLGVVAHHNVPYTAGGGGGRPENVHLLMVDKVPFLNVEYEDRDMDDRSMCSTLTPSIVSIVRLRSNTGDFEDWNVDGGGGGDEGDMPLQGDKPPPSAVVGGASDDSSEASLDASDFLGGGGGGDDEPVKSTRSNGQPRTRRRGLSNTDKQGDTMDINNMSMKSLGGLSNGGGSLHKVTRTSSRLVQKRERKMQMEAAQQQHQSSSPSPQEEEEEEAPPSNLSMAPQPTYGERKRMDERRKRTTTATTTTRQRTPPPPPPPRDEDSDNEEAASIPAWKLRLQVQQKRQMQAPHVPVRRTSEVESVEVAAEDKPVSPPLRQTSDHNHNRDDYNGGDGDDDDDDAPHDGLCTRRPFSPGVVVRNDVMPHSPLRRRESKFAKKSPFSVCPPGCDEPPRSPLRGSSNVQENVCYSMTSERSQRILEALSPKPIGALPPAFAVSFSSPGTSHRAAGYRKSLPKPPSLETTKEDRKTGNEDNKDCGGDRRRRLMRTKSTRQSATTTMTDDRTEEKKSEQDEDNQDDGGDRRRRLTRNKSTRQVERQPSGKSQRPAEREPQKNTSSHSAPQRPARRGSVQMVSSNSSDNSNHDDDSVKLVDHVVEERKRPLAAWQVRERSKGRIV
jgi:hypothetical protein